MSIAYHLCRASWQTIHKSPELFFSLAILMVWNTLSAPTRPLGLWIGAVLVVPLCYYGYRVLGATPWMKRLGWIAPPRTFWAGSLAAGFVLALAIVVVARTLGQPLGTVRSIRLVLLATTVGPLLEELFFRGLLYRALHKAMRHLGLRPGIVYPLTVMILGVLFAFAHTGRAPVQLWSTLFTGMGYGVMRVLSGSSACASLMHASYNLSICMFGW